MRIKGGLLFFFPVNYVFLPTNYPFHTLSIDYSEDYVNVTWMHEHSQSGPGFIFFQFFQSSQFTYLFFFV